ncbi:hypothetical protein GCM10011343_25350 [Flavobacterium orientale]|uniref:Uncharacterized protein n=1 Tax=Flavobacterium orientale TaxID=1756020 RepID=A0A916Y8A4_9FLAO|nr:hypothetical protein GCM10011343_25350 [Flavobacterium orientale]
MSFVSPISINESVLSRLFELNSPPFSGLKTFTLVSSPKLSKTLFVSFIISLRSLTVKLLYAEGKITK